MAAPMDFLPVALAAADAAAVAVRPYFRVGLQADAKADDSPVTLADRAAEQAMRAVLAAHCPDHGIIGEEFGGTETGQSGFTWVLDPIDGTRAFITGRTTFGTLIALLQDGVPVIGIIDQPITGERWVGVAGRPTEFTGPLGGKAACRPCPDLGRAELSCTSPDIFSDDTRPRFERLRAATLRTSWGGDCYAFGLLALGQIDLIVEDDLKPWDWAALVPVVTGAGGSITDWAGAPLRLGCSGQVIALGDPSLLPAVIQHLT
ncbi:inositol monophosphatase family protein [Acidisoma silvae]|uniref:Inositol monophosphatase family protein n=1 Tax=Acidisoma silvae TaxID=2802396 RepID=A0A963YMM7_9PROT|nr:inositol monophosphatase family protein [Acidisoma silvae]MCB8873551.1 inositol monophosphatase family protein [Acidisoma silvae]